MQEAGRPETVSKSNRRNIKNTIILFLAISLASARENSRLFLSDSI